MELANLDFKERVKKYFALRTRGCGRLVFRCPVFFPLLALAWSPLRLCLFSRSCLSSFFPPFFAPPYASCRTACSERGCVANPAERPARSPAEAGAEALKLAFESLSQADKKVFCIDVDPVPSLSVAEVSTCRFAVPAPADFLLTAN